MLAQIDSNVVIALVLGGFFLLQTILVVLAVRSAGRGQPQPPPATKVGFGLGSWVIVFFCLIWSAMTLAADIWVGQDMVKQFHTQFYATVEGEVLNGIVFHTPDYDSVFAGGAHAGKAHVGFRQYINIRMHSGRDVYNLALAEVAHGPPCPRIDQREYFLPNVSVGTLGNIQVGHESIERRVNPAIVEVITGVLYCRLSGAALIHKWLEGGHRMLRLLVLCFALVQIGL